MKKILALVLASLMMLCSVAMAEDAVHQEEVYKENPLFSSENFTGEMPERSSVKFSKKTENYAPPATTDTVIVKDSVVVVKTEDNVLMLAMVPANYTCVTQDYTASIFALMPFSDPEGLVQTLIDNDIHLLFVNNLNDDLIKIYTPGTDSVASVVGDLSKLSSDRVREYANAFSASYDVTFNDTVNAGTYTWMRFDETVLVTVVGGQYVFAMWEGDDEDTFTEDTLQDMVDVLNDLMLFVG